MAEDGFTIAEAVARCGLPESTLRYWERIGLVRSIERDASSHHRRYTREDVATLETLVPPNLSTSQGWLSTNWGEEDM